MISVSDEQDFVTQYLEALSQRSVRFGDDYTAHPLPSVVRIKRKPVAVSQPTESSPVQSNVADLTVKILKPASQFTLKQVDLTDNVSALKQLIYQHVTTITPGQQRLLLKGKVLADNKALCECGVQQGSVVHVMVTAARSEPAETKGKWGLSLASEKVVESQEFRDVLYETVIQQLKDKADADIVFDKIKQALN